MIRVGDVETTGMEPTDEVVELGCVDVTPDSSDPVVVGSSLVKPERPIPPEASAIHHITDEMVKDAPPWAEVWPRFLGAETTKGITAFAAHKADFDGMWLTEHRRGGRPIICTWKAALRAWPEAPGHSNQCLRYWLRFIVPDLAAPHRAIPDAFVTAKILMELLEIATLEQLIAWSGEPALLPKIPIGEHRGKPWREVPADFLQWMLTKKDMGADLLWNARHELEARDERMRKEMAERRAAYADLAKKAAKTAVTVEDLNSWFRGECGNREALSIIAGTPEYTAIVDECLAIKTAILSNSAIQFQGVSA